MYLILSPLLRLDKGLDFIQKFSIFIVFQIGFIWHMAKWYLCIIQNTLNKWSLVL